MPKHSDSVEFIHGDGRICETYKPEPWLNLKWLRVVYYPRVERPVCEGNIMCENRVYTSKERDAEDHITEVSGVQKFVRSLDRTNAHLRGSILASCEVQRMEGDNHVVYGNGHVEGGFAWDVV